MIADISVVQLEQGLEVFDQLNFGLWTKQVEYKLLEKFGKA